MQRSNITHPPAPSPPPLILSSPCSHHLVVKKMRYYARFIVVCLLLNKKAMVKTLTEHLGEAVYNYTKFFKPGDAGEWQIVLQEIATFYEADTKLLPGDLESLRGRLVSTRAAPSPSPTSLAPGEAARPRFRIQEAVLVGNRHDQVKFSELTLDIYRMLQILEKEPPGREARPEEREAFEKDMHRRPNPRKYLLYRTTFRELVTFLASSFKELADHTALLLYLSADDVAPLSRRHGRPAAAAGLPQIESSAIIANGGVWLGPLRKHDDPHAAGEAHADQGCLYPHDLFPFLRRPLILIVDSPNSVAFDVSLIFVALWWPFFTKPPFLFFPHLCPSQFPSSLASRFSACCRPPSTRPT